MELEARVKPQVETWAHGVKVIGKIYQRHPELAYAGFGISLQSEWQYLQTVPGVGSIIGPIKEIIREKIPPLLLGGEEITVDFRKILGNSVNRGGLGIPDPRLLVERASNTSKTASMELVDSLLGGSI